MKIKSFTAPDTTQAMSMIRAELGDEAIIISAETAADGICMTAAIENSENIDCEADGHLKIVSGYDDVIMRESLEYHDILPDISGQILAMLRQNSLKSGMTDNQTLLTQTLEQMYSFVPLLSSPSPVKIFLGAPGCGKSTVVAKAAMQAKLKNIRTAVISTDNVRAGANKQLEAFAAILQIDFYFCKNSRDLFERVSQGREQYDVQLVDTPGINPYQEDEVCMLDELIDSVKADKILVQDAGRNTLEAVETAEIFSRRLGVDMILPTRLDMTKRIGSIISSANSNRLSFCSGSVSSNIAKGLTDMTPAALARLILAN